MQKYATIPISHFQISLEQPYFISKYGRFHTYTNVLYEVLHIYFIFVYIVFCAALAKSMSKSEPLIQVCLFSISTQLVKASQHTVKPLFIKRALCMEGTVVLKQQSVS